MSDADEMRQYVRFSQSLAKGFGMQVYWLLMLPSVLWNCTFDNAEVSTAIYGICEVILCNASPVPILVVLWHDIPQSVNAKGNRGDQI